jgi:hypothetical protein
MKHKKAQVTYYLFFVIGFLFLALVAAVIIPMLVLFSTQMYGAGEGMLNKSLVIASNIDDPEVRNTLTGTMTAARDSSIDNITVLSTVYQYSWILIGGISALTLFILLRRNVEFTGGGFV